MLGQGKVKLDDIPNDQPNSPDCSFPGPGKGLIHYINYNVR